MADLLPRLRRWWDSARASWSGQRVPYSVACRCGHTLRGHRQRRYQVLRCQTCRRSVFILPYSAYPAILAVETRVPKGKAAARSPFPPRARFRAWLLPTLAALLTLLVAVIGFLKVSAMIRRPIKTEVNVLPAREEYDRLVAEGRSDLAEGNFALAVKTFHEAVQLRDNRPGLVDPADRPGLNQLYGQSYVLAKRLDLVDLLKKANEFSNAGDWDEHFKEEFRGKTVVFDDIVYVDREDRLGLREGSEPRWKKVRGRVVLDDLKLLKHLEKPKRWIFGARLLSCKGSAEEWEIRFEPDSGVLLTDREALIKWKPELRQDPELPELLRRQEQSLGKVLVPEP